MRSGRRERSFSSNYFIPKCNYIEESFFQIAQQNNRKLMFFFFTLFKFRFSCLYYLAFRVDGSQLLPAKNWTVAYIDQNEYVI